MILDGSVRVSKSSVLVVSGGGATDGAEKVDVQGAAPQFRVVNTTMYEVKIYPCVIHSEDQEQVNPIDQVWLDTLLAEVNTIFRQGGMHFSYGASIMNITNSVWAKNGLIDQFIGSRIRNIMYGTDGLEVYFIAGLDVNDKRKKDEPVGKCNSYGIILRYGASANAFAHELGHACLWPDIYARRKKNAPEILKEYLQSSWVPDDWNNGTGQRYYGQLLQQRDIIGRLLMHGVDNAAHVDIPLGTVYGLGRDGVVGHMNVGRNGVMTVSPQSQ